MRHKINLIIAYLLLSLTSCSINKDEISGVYITPGLKNNVDTLVILKNGTYEHKIYDKKSKSLTFYHKDKWSFNRDYLRLENFYNNRDEQYTPEYNFKIGQINTSVIPKRQGGTIIFDYGDYSDGKFIYNKIK